MPEELILTERTGCSIKESVMGSFVPRTTLSQFRKRRKISLDGRVPGVLYSRQHRSQQPASVPIEKLTGGAVPRSYMSFHPDAYEPHPGEAVFMDSHYTPGQTEAPRFAPDELRGQEPSVAHAEAVGPQIDSDHAAFLLRRFVNDLTSQPAPDAIPAEHDVAFEGPTGPTIGDSVGDPSRISAIWDRVLDRPSYDSLSMTNELFDETMQDATGAAGDSCSITADDVTGGDIPGGQDVPLEYADEIAGQDDGMLHDPLGETTFNPTGAPEIYGDAAFLPGDQVAPGFDAPHAATHGEDPAPYGLDEGPMNPLEQIVDGLAPAVPGPEPMQEQPYADEMLMDPWMMPGMGLMPPGLGPMGPMGPLGPIL